jgi:hypothetical protein
MARVKWHSIAPVTACLAFQTTEVPYWFHLSMTIQAFCKKGEGWLVGESFCESAGNVTYYNVSSDVMREILNTRCGIPNCPGDLRNFI